jgi:Zn-dependent M28 family amino/carboxypeptidase
MRRFLIASLAAVSLLAGLLAPTGAQAAQVSTKELRDAVAPWKIRQHLQRLQEIADNNGDTRASGTPGYDASANYVARTLRRAGYEVTRQHFDYLFFQELSDPVMRRVSPDPKTYVNPDEFITMDYSATGNPTADLVPTNDIVIPPGADPSTSNSGCEPGDFPAETSGNIALIQRGFCDFVVKAQNAQDAGAVGVIIFNEGQPGRDETLAGTLGETEEITIPVVGTSFAIGEDLYEREQNGQDVVFELKTHTLRDPRSAQNVLADTTGRRDRLVVVGAHLDSVVEGPGIQDNGTGSATILEIAEQIAELDYAPRNRIRFAWWGAEEAGLVGSEYYVGRLGNQQYFNHSLYLNFDMIGSPNFARFIYDGSGDLGTAGPEGSVMIERVFEAYFNGQGLAHEPTEFDGRSDYNPFILVDIPAGGLFTGAEQHKTPEQVALYGGTAGVAYDECYHQPCDTIDNVNMTGLSQMADAAAHATWRLANRRLPEDWADEEAAQMTAASGSDYDGAHLVR